MSLYTRFPNANMRDHSSASSSRGKHQEAAERFFQQTPERPLTREDKTAQVARQIVLEESERRRALSETLKTARLERAGHFMESARNKRDVEPGQ